MRPSTFAAPAGMDSYGKQRFVVETADTAGGRWLEFCHFVLYRGGRTIMSKLLDAPPPKLRSANY